MPQAPGACGPGLQGAWGPGPQGLGPGPPNDDFFANLLAGAWRRRGCRLKRLLWRWGPGGKRSRDTPPTPPPPPPPPRFGAVREKGRGFSPSPPSATIQHAPQGRRTQSEYSHDSTVVRRVINNSINNTNNSNNDNHDDYLAIFGQEAKFLVSVSYPKIGEPQYRPQHAF